MRRWTAIPGLLAIAVLAVVLSAYSGASTSERQPDQPIEFPHNRHAGGSLQMNCLYCHYTANKSETAGIPAVSTCMGCHTVVLAQSPEVQKLAQYWSTSQPIPWNRVHKVPEYVQFPHFRHVNAGVSCQECHGQIQEMTVAAQVSSLNMGWCVNCHIERQARYDCAICHY